MISMYKDIFSSVEIILASNSPRRKQFFKEAGIPFTVKTFNVDEVFSPELKGAAISDYLVKLKAAPFQGSILTDQIIITADTIVWGNEQYLGKPKTKEHAKEMLHLLSFCPVDYIFLYKFCYQAYIYLFYQGLCP